MNWNPIWGQAMCPLSLPFLVHPKSTVRFSVRSPLSGSHVRLRFSNLLGKQAYVIGECTIASGGIRRQVTLQGSKQLAIPHGEVVFSDVVELPVTSGEHVEVRLYFGNRPGEGNAIEAEATLAKRANLTHAEAFPPRKHSRFREKNHFYTIVPVLDAIEVSSSQEPPPHPTVIVAFGDSITQQGEWTRPLAVKLFESYQDRVILLNKGIGGNRILHPGKGLLSICGEAAQDRLERDVLGIQGIKTVILALGTNDISAAKRNSKKYVTASQLTAAIQAMVERMKARGIAVIGTTLLPRGGSMGYKSYHEATRNAVNAWIRSYDGFDDVVDFDQATRSDTDPARLSEAYDCGDHLHPSSEGGRVMTEAINVGKLL